jgi:hypothetical protein
VIINKEKLDCAEIKEVKVYKPKPDLQRKELIPDIHELLYAERKEVIFDKGKLD